METEKLRELGRAARISSQALQMGLERRAWGRRKFREWIQVLRELARFDKLVEAQSKQYRKKAILLGVLAAVGVFLLPLVLGIVTGLAAFVGTWAAILFAMVYLTGLALLGVRILGILKDMGRLKEADLDNNLRRLLLPFLEALAEDVHGTAKATLRLELSGIHKDKVVGHRSYERIELVGNVRRKARYTEVLYDCPWCYVRLPLRNGCTLEVWVRDRILERRRTRANAAGRVKTKVKFIRRVFARVRLAPRPDRYVWDEDAAYALARQGRLIRLKQRGDTRIGEIVEKARFKSPMRLSDDTVSPELLLGMALTLVGLLRPVGNMGGGDGPWNRRWVPGSQGFARPA